MELLQRRLANLLTVKSLVTVTLTAVFSYLAVTGHVSTEQFLTVFTVVIAFYFGTQAEKRARETGEGSAADAVGVVAEADGMRAVPGFSEGAQ